MRFFAPAFVPPGIDHQENENHETEEQENYRPGFVLPKLLEAPGNLVKIHANNNSTPLPAKNEMGLHRAELGISPGVP